MIKTDTRFDSKIIEEKLYRFWEESGFFTPKINLHKNPFTIILPLPNANDPMHIGHALFTIEDVLIRYHRMLGEPALWVPGSDHAGIETQFVFEKKLAKEGKSRFDFDRDTLYKMIEEFVQTNKNINLAQMKRLGFSLDWTHFHYSLEPEIVLKVLNTFRKLHQDDLVYRDKRLINYCVNCGTSFSDLEVEYQEQDDPFYYLDYGTLQIATTRPETIFADSAVAVNPKDQKYQKLVGQQAVIPLVNRQIPIITDEAVQIGFGTGALKVTPGHDVTDFEIGQRHDLTALQVINLSGRMINVPEKYLGLNIKQARRAIVEDLKTTGKLLAEKVINHTVGRCYRCKNIIEPTLLAQWFIKTKPLAAAAIKAVKEGKTKIVPKRRFEKMYFDWLENIHDWNISRQIVWGPRIPVWYCLACNQNIVVNFIDKKGLKVSGTYQEISQNYTFAEIKQGLQNLIAGKDVTYSLEETACGTCGEQAILQETDTFDTWFLSGQWPLNVLGYPGSKDFKYFYPTAVLDTLWDILFFWVARMMMFGLYLTGEVPFKVIHLHARVVDEKGQKMSKSKGNVINPIEMVDKYGADALRLSLVFGVSPGSDVHLSEDKIRSMRNFVTKIWNIARFIIDMKPAENPPLDKAQGQKATQNPDDKWIREELSKLITQVTKDLNNYQFHLATEAIHDFIWHKLADVYIEKSKSRRSEAQPVLEEVLKICLQLLHPFMPFITEELWHKLPGISQQDSVMLSSWPEKTKTRY